METIGAEQLLGIDLTQITLLDVRSKIEYGLGTIPGSINAPFNYDEEEFEASALETIKSLSKNIPVYVFCHTGPRSEIAAEILEEEGFQAIDVEGGYRAYQVALINRGN